MSAWLLGWLIGSGVAAFIVNALWTIAWQRNRRIAQREHDSICDQISRDGRAEIERLRGIVATHEDAICDHKEQIANREQEVANLESQRDQAAKRILSREDSYRAKCGELDAKTQELQQIKQVINQSWRLVWPDESAITATSTFQPKRPEDQPQKPTCDN